MQQLTIESKLRKWAGFLLAYTILVILWGAWVRISHSGDGCGDTWPLCHGQLVPEAARAKTWVEYGHRFTSGLYGLFVFGLFLWVRKLRVQWNLERVHFWALWTMVFMISEAALGAKLVLFKLVNSDQSNWRLIVMSLHQLNSFLLVACTVRFLASSYETDYRSRYIHTQAKSPSLRWLSRPIFLILFLVIAVTGAWAALSTTLFPSASLLDGLAKDMASDSHIVLKIRGLHPLFGLLIGGTLSVELYRMSSQVNLFLSRVALFGSLLVACGIVLGIVTLVLLSPVPLKLLHLLLAHLLWSTSVYFYHFYSLPDVSKSSKKMETEPRVLEKKLSLSTID